MDQKKKKNNVQRQMQPQPSLFDKFRPIHTHTFKIITKTKNYKKNLINNSNISIYTYTQLYIEIQTKSENRMKKKQTKKICKNFEEKIKL